MHRSLSVWCAAVVAAQVACTRPPEPVRPGSGETLAARMEARLARVNGELVAFRRDIHAHPELSGLEERTAGLVAARLRALGLTVREGVGGHGVVGVLEGGERGPVVAYRADMDAVASDAPDPVAFRSQTPGVRHICGHDVHVAVGLGVAEALVEVRADLRGTVVFLFQPAEENAQGAAAMIEAGALGEPAPEAIFAVHSAPLPVGTIGSVAGLALPGLSLIEISIEGDGDAEAAAAAFAEVVHRANTVTEAAVSSLGQPVAGAPPPGDQVSAVVFHSGRAEPGAPWQLRAMLRATSEAAYEGALAGIEAGLSEVPAAGIHYRLEVARNVIPPTINDAALVRAALGPLRAAVGAERVIEIDRPIPSFSEDFAFFQQRIPGAMFWLGVSNEERGIVGLPHSPGFAADEGAIGVGARAMAAVIVAYLSDRGPR